MDGTASNECSNDEEENIFFGDFKKSEIKHLIALGRQTIFEVVPHEDSSNDSITLIETHSEPELTLRVSNSDNNHLNTLPNDCCNLPNGPDQTEIKLVKEHQESSHRDMFQTPYGTPEKYLELKYIEKSLTPCMIPQDSPGTSHTILDNSNIFATPLSELIIQNVNPALKELNLNKYKPVEQSQLFKTPSMSSSTASAIKSKKKPAFCDISSPVAFSIHNSPDINMLKKMNVRKLTPGPSGIPKLVKQSLETRCNYKENLELDRLGYCTAKKTMVKLSDGTKMSDNRQIKKTFSLLPRPIILQHEGRENVNKIKSVTNMDAEINDLSLRQADVSLCTVKPASKASLLRKK